MAIQWYFERNGTCFGPFSAEQLKRLAASGQIQPQDSVRKEGMSKGVLAAKVKYLFSNALLPLPAASVTDSTPPPALPAIQATPAAKPAVISSEPGLAAAADSVPPSTIATVPNSPTDQNQLSNPAGATAPLLSEEAQHGSVRQEPRRPQPEVRKRRVLEVKGGVDVSQDGVYVRFRKKCPKCGYGDTCMTTMSIPSGSMRVNFFCPKCKKNFPVEVQGVG